MSTTLTAAFVILATRLDNNGQRVDANNPETLGDAHGRRYATEADALAAASDLTDSAAAYGMADAVYTVVNA